MGDFSRISFYSFNINPLFTAKKKPKKTIKIALVHRKNEKIRKIGQNVLSQNVLHTTFLFYNIRNDNYYYSTW